MGITSAQEDEQNEQKEGHYDVVSGQNKILLYIINNLH